MREWKRRVLCGKHFCNDCEWAFIRRAERDFIYCPFCGKALTLHMDNPAMQRIVKSNPFKDFEK